MRILARLLKLIPRRGVRPALLVPANTNTAVDHLPRVIGPDEWRFIALTDRSMAWYFDRR